jgi:hypothetical protein
VGGIGNVVVNTIVRMITRKAIGTAMKSAKKGKASRAPEKKARPTTRSSAIRGLRLLPAFQTVS